ncbi:WhiB family transcriptional regulator [Yinghuangia sp. YIM S09857]|uniref:WhiB family transcriptional regulator n=1 Tax=Yinghuangia sp. YIM S09857 TaxID=3436929 RepID=UPI003F52DD82
MSVKKAATGPRKRWENAAACRDSSGTSAYAEWFSEPDGVRETDAAREMRERAAKSLCRSCPVRRDCLVAALEERDEHTIRGGLTVEERRALRRKANRTAAEVAKAA